MFRSQLTLFVFYWQQIYTNALDHHFKGKIFIKINSYTHHTVVHKATIYDSFSSKNDWMNLFIVSVVLLCVSIPFQISWWLKWFNSSWYKFEFMENVSSLDYIVISVVFSRKMTDFLLHPCMTLTMNARKSLTIVFSMYRCGFWIECKKC